MFRNSEAAYPGFCNEMNSIGFRENRAASRRKQNVPSVVRKLLLPFLKLELGTITDKNNEIPYLPLLCILRCDCIFTHRVFLARKSTSYLPLQALHRSE